MLDFPLEERAKDRLLSKISKMNTRDTANLDKLLSLVPNTRVLVVQTVSMEDGLCNGVLGLLKKVDMIGNDVSKVWIKFDESFIGQIQRSKYRRYYQEDIDPSWTPVFKLTRQFIVSHGTNTYTAVRRTQFPIRLACAMTIHKAEGMTFCLPIEVDFRAKPICYHLVYTGISRVQSLEQLFIIDRFDANKIRVNPVVQTEMNSLRSDKICTPLSLSTENAQMILLFQNIQSIRKYFNIAAKQPLFSESDIIVFCESWLNSSDSTEDFQVNSHEMHRFDYHDESNRRPHAGFVAYTKDPMIFRDSIKHFCQFLVTYVPLHNFVLIALHRRPRETSISNFKAALRQTIQENSYSRMCVVGDFNLDISCNKNFLSFMSELDFIYKESVFTTVGKTTIDLVFSRNVPLNLIVSETVTSYHKPMILSFK